MQVFLSISLLVAVPLPGARAGRAGGEAPAGQRHRAWEQVVGVTPECLFTWKRHGSLPEIAGATWQGQGAPFPRGETLTGSLLRGSDLGQRRGPCSHTLLSLPRSDCSEEVVANLRAPLCFSLLNITTRFLRAGAWPAVLASSGLAAGP